MANHEKDLERTRERVKALGESHEGGVVERSSILAESEALVEEAARLGLLGSARQLLEAGEVGAAFIVEREDR